MSSIDTHKSHPTRALKGEPSVSYASYALFVLMVCYTLSFVDRQILSLLVGPIKQDLGLSDTRMGLLQGLSFALFYTTLGLPIGHIADTRSRRTLISVGVLFWSFMTVVCAGARSFSSLFLARMGVGVGEATLAPAAFSLITDYFPREHLGRALSVYSMGIFIGSGLALIVGGSVVEATTRMSAVDLPVLGVVAPWRLTFLIVGAPGLLVAFWAFTLKEPLRKSLLLDRTGQPSTLTVGQVLEQVFVRWRSVFGGRTLGLLIVGFGCLGMFAGGVLTDYWRKRGIRDAPLRVGVISGIGTAALFVPALTTSDVRLTIALYGPALFFLGLPMGVSYAALQWILPNQVRGQVSALFLLILNLGGLTLGPQVPVFFSDYVFQSEMMIGTGLGISIGLASILMILVFLVTLRPYRAHSAAMDALAQPAAAY